MLCIGQPTFLLGLNNFVYWSNNDFIKSFFNVFNVLNKDACYV